MNFVKIHKHPIHGLYTHYEASDESMYLLGSFFSDIRCDNDSVLFFQQWPFDDSQSDSISTNAIHLEKNNHCIYLKSAIQGDNDYNNVELILSDQQFGQLMHNWHEKICKHKPQEIIITYDNNQFIIETN